ncbi:MAG: ShlB/FhaC/HecB family hemolysin secretion/activation protein, partial [Geobacteraceae bacterium]|nr:ShlB/FhaC/HecB family hemolysin secretion/activation protein [Geobacteraceae bacterium]
MSRSFSSRFARAYFLRQVVALLFFLLLLLHLLLVSARAEEDGKGVSEAASSDEPGREGTASPARESGETFPIRRFVIYGYTAFPRDTLVKLVDDLRGPGRTSAHVEAARDRIEKFYHDGGYPTTMVNIPEQSVSSGFVYLQVIEGKVGNVAVKGNRWVGEERIRSKLPSLASKEVVNLPRIKEELQEVASVPDLKVTPAISPGKETGTVDVDLVVE